MDKVGTCLHNIFCVLEQNPTEAKVSEIIKNHRMTEDLPNTAEILTAWTNLESFLTENMVQKVAHTTNCHLSSIMMDRFLPEA